MLSHRLVEIAEAILDGAGETLTSGTIALTGGVQRISSTSIPCKSIWLYNHTGNDVLYWGGSTVTTNHPALAASTGKEIDINNVNKLYFKGTNAQHVGYAYTA